MQGFQATFRQPELSKAHVQVLQQEPSPPFEVLLVEDLVPHRFLEAYLSAQAQEVCDV